MDEPLNGVLHVQRPFNSVGTALGISSLGEIVGWAMLDQFPPRLRHQVFAVSNPVSHPALRKFAGTPPKSFEILAIPNVVQLPL